MYVVDITNVSKQVKIVDVSQKILSNMHGTCTNVNSFKLFKLNNVNKL